MPIFLSITCRRCSAGSKHRSTNICTCAARFSTCRNLATSRQFDGRPLTHASARVMVSHSSSPPLYTPGKPLRRCQYLNFCASKTIAVYCKQAFTHAPVTAALPQSFSPAAAVESCNASGAATLHLDAQRPADTGRSPCGTTSANACRRKGRQTMYSQMYTLQVW
jgi:hypothetical protein